MCEYIKVTPKGESAPRIVLASLKNFYIAQGTKPSFSVKFKRKKRTAY